MICDKCGKNHDVVPNNYAHYKGKNYCNWYCAKKK